MSQKSTFGLSSPALNRAMATLGWNPTPIQKMAIQPLRQNHDRLLVAPTGSGKTMAAVLPLLDRCIDENWTGLSILYITPLRALNRDVDRRMRWLAEEVGLRVGLRHGDTSQNERQKQVRRPPNMLVTTPETFQLMFSGHRLLELLKTVKAVVVDEVHDLAASERGWQLSIGLSRLEAHSGNRVQRIGLSATVGNPDEVARWLSPHTEAITVEGMRATELLVEATHANASDEVAGLGLGLSGRAYAALKLLAERVSEKSPCLIFVNSRNAAETVSQRLEVIAPQLRIGVHHGSLATETRQQMEDDLRMERLDGLVCTSSLELGIDIGSIAHVLQLRSPRSVDRMLQRAGRAEHHLDGVGRGRVICWESDDIAESAVIARRAHEGLIEPVEWRLRPLSVVANQLVQMARCHGAIPIIEATEIIATTPQFEGWTVADTCEIIRLLEDGWLLRLVEDSSKKPWWTWHKVIWSEARALSKQELPEQRPSPATGEEGVPKGFEDLLVELPSRFKDGWFSPASRTRQYALEHISMIPDRQSYRVRDAVTRRSLGSVDEAFVLSLDAGGDEEDGNRRRFVMAGRTWQVIDADPEQEELLVIPVSDQGTAPVWSGELPPTPAAVAREVGRLRHLLAVDVGAQMLEVGGSDPLGLLCDEDIEASDHPLEAQARGLLVDDVLSHLNSAGSIPSERCITIEERDEAIVVNCCQGSRINEALAHLMQAMASTKSGRMGRILVEATRFSLQMGGVNAQDIVKWFEQTPADAVEGILSLTLPNSRQVRWRFAEVAKVFGVLRKGVDPRRINLRALLQKYRGTVVMREVLSRLFHERMDCEGAADVLRAVKQGIIRLEITPAGSLGLSPKGEKDLLMPNWSNVEVRERLESRLMNERAVLCCLKCYGTMTFRVARFDDIKLECRHCGGRMLACAREGLRELLEKWVSSKERTDMDRMNRCAEAIRRRGVDAVLCLMGRGIGETTTTRLLRTVPSGDRNALLEAIHKAEVTYARTRRFW